MLVVEIGHAEFLTHQLFTCKMVRPVSWASCFFCSSDGYGCCRSKQRERTHTHMSLFDKQINVQTCERHYCRMYTLFFSVFVVLCNPKKLHLRMTPGQPCPSLAQYRHSQHTRVHPLVNTHARIQYSAKPVRAGQTSLSKLSTMITPVLIPVPVPAHAQTNSID